MKKIILSFAVILAANLSYSSKIEIEEGTDKNALRSEKLICKNTDNDGKATSGSKKGASPLSLEKNALRKSKLDQAKENGERLRRLYLLYIQQEFLKQQIPQLTQQVEKLETLKVSYLQIFEKSAPAPIPFYVSPPISRANFCSILPSPFQPK